MVNLYNESFDLLTNGTVLEAASSLYEEAFTFGGVAWFYPILFLMTLFLVAIKSESPSMVAIYAILGSVALKGLIVGITWKIFWIIIVFSLLIWMFSLFLSPKTGG